MWFLFGIGVCAVLSTQDIIFDRYIMENRYLASIFYAFCIFASFNIFLPLLFGVRNMVIPGVSLVRRVAELVAKRDRIRAERGLDVRRLLARPDRVVGVTGVDAAGRERVVRASAVNLACGGAGAIYARHDNQASIMGQGYYLAACAGLALWDMEFVQCYPIVLDEPGMPMMMIYPPYPREATLIGQDGAELLKKHDLGNINQAIVRKRDTFAAMLVAEGKAGPVRMDLRAVPEEAWSVK